MEHLKSIWALAKANKKISIGAVVVIIILISLIN
jgi:hypothetical protein